MIEKIGHYYHIHPLSLEDIVHIDQRPKFEEFDHYLICIYRAFYYKEGNIGDGSPFQGLISEQLSLVLAKNNTVLSFQENISPDPFEEIRTRLHNSKAKSVVRGPIICYMLY